VTGHDEEYMQAALKLAQRGTGSVEPNPAVGCVIVKGSQVIGKGWHRKFGAPHAETVAMEDCRTIGASAGGATMYVTLEPCCHHAKTPPCTDAIIEAELARVVVAVIDPSAHANGRGLAQLRDAGIKVDIGVCANQARLLNAPFIKFAATGKCWITLKWAQTIDGKLAWAENSSERRWISNEAGRKDAHKLRRRSAAILVGINTVIADDPLLTPRPSGGKKPTRIVLDSNLRIPLDCQLLATAGKSPVMVVTSLRTVETNPHAAQAVRQKGAELLAFPDVPGQSNLNFLIDELSSRGVGQLLVEGGPTVIGSFLKQGLADELCVYVSPKLLGSAGTAEITAPLLQLSEPLELNYAEIKRFEDNVRLTGLSKRAMEDISISRA
jgi:diaminohydroxyphosphoribosylaminopyrimidine deaminase/5-amino-6-(5-phosphoribosylamino)uracil reductase